MAQGTVVDQDLEHLRLLKIFQYVYAGLTGLFGLFPLIYIGMGAMIVSGSLPMGPPSRGGGPGPEMMGWFFIAFGGAFVLFVETLAVLTFFAARSIADHRRRVFCMVIAAFQCLNMPLGTILGVFTLVVLSRPSVKALFEDGDRAIYP